ncbi:hypothetical protein HY488_00655 [Candidatus Woesearchaeota archaeon]|nr:hypothetical protein [Candidatus Woesearchaeota archaeon]
MFGRQKEEPADHRIKQAMLSAANRALEYKKMNPKATDHDVLDYVMRTTNDILQEID